MHLTKERPKTELQMIIDLCNEAGFNFDETPLSAEYDTMGNILHIETTDKKLQTILKAQGFTN
tara:strand:+ start:84 stop:272 length:189 start_codon:yes stop_codon:yes gene_type:complete